MDEQRAVVAAPRDRDAEALVVLAEEELVVVGAGPQVVAPQLEGSPRVVDAHVEEGPGVRGERRGVGDVLDRLWGRLATVQRGERDRVALIAGEVDADRAQRVVGCDLEDADRAEVVALGEHVLVEEHLLARGVEARRVARAGVRASAVHRVALGLEGPLVVPPRTPSDRRGHVGLLDARDDLVVDRLLERRGPLELLAREVVLRGEVGEDVGVVAIAEPEEVVDADVVEVGERGRATRSGGGGHGRSLPARAGRPRRGIELLLCR